MQADLASALAQQSDTPAGFDSDRVDLAARMLLHKRRKSVAHVIPRVAAELGREFIPLFARYLRSFPHPPVGGPVIDALEFADWLGLTRLSESRGIELIRLDLSVRRRMRCVRLSSRVVIGIRLPILGVRMLRFPMVSGSKTPSYADQKFSVPVDRPAADGVR